jgi:hypothetical protein
MHADADADAGADAGRMHEGHGWPLGHPPSQSDSILAS